MEPTLRVERVFNLGDYKSLRSVAMESDLDHAERLSIMIDNVVDAHEQFLINQILEADLYGKDSDKWREKLVELNNLREEYKNSLFVENTEGE